jgi:uncharacterized membrane-anchored protein
MKYAIKHHYCEGADYLASKFIEFEAEDDAAAVKIAEAMQEEDDKAYIAEQVARGFTEEHVINSNDYLFASNYVNHIVRIEEDEDGFETEVPVEI